MIRAVFSQDEGGFCGFDISGHAGMGEAQNDHDGNDIVCAAVSSCTMLVCNCITESFGNKAKVFVKKNHIELKLLESVGAVERLPAELLIKAFHEHLSAISEDHKNAVKLIIDGGKSND